MKEKVCAIILSAGMGKRMNANKPKQYLNILGKPIIYYTLKQFEQSNIDKIILVVGKDDKDFCTNEIVNKYGIKKVTAIVEGGKERYNSVLNGLKACDSNTNYVLIHDGARPFIEEDTINTVVDKVKSEKALIVAVPVKDTIKVVDEDGYVSSTPNRDTLWQVQTPQAFDYNKIKNAYENVLSNIDNITSKITDDAMIWEETYKEKIKIINGSYNNIKITTKEDLSLSEKILEERKK